MTWVLCVRPEGGRGSLHAGFGELFVAWALGQGFRCRLVEEGRDQIAVEVVGDRIVMRAVVHEAQRSGYEVALDCPGK